MTYNFSKLTQRYQTNSLKWDVQKDELPMWVADMDFETAPEIIEALKQRVQHGIFGYNIVPNEFYNAIHDWWLKHHRFDINPEWMMFSTGVVPAISSIVRKMTTVGENILIQSPVYNIFYNSIINNGRQVLSSDLIYDGHSYTIDFDDLERKLALPQTTLMILCNPHNPIGKIWDRETLEKIGNLCHQHHVLVISDEIHCDLVDPGSHYIPFASVSKICRDISMTCIAPTKAFNLAGLQVACLVIPNATLRHKVNRGINTDEVAEPNSFAITATIAAFTQGESWLHALCEYIKDNKDIAQKFINEHLDILYLVPSQATYLLWIDCSRITDDSVAFTEYIRKTTGLYISDGYEYGDNGKTFIRMNIACPRERLMDGLKRLHQGVKNYMHQDHFTDEDFQRLHQMEDILNLEFKYHASTQEIINQYLFQKHLISHGDHHLTLDNEELHLLSTLIHTFITGHKER